MKRRSSNRSSSEHAENVFCQPVLWPGNRRWVAQTIEEESNPPERQEPTGTSARNRSRTESNSKSRNATAASSKVPSNDFGCTWYHASIFGGSCVLGVCRHAWQSNRAKQPGESWNTPAKNVSPE